MTNGLARVPRRTILSGLAAAPVAGLLARRGHAQGPGDPVAAAVAASGAPALAAAVFDAQKTLFIGAAGMRLKGGETPVTTADLWHLGSNTKAMTALLYVRLVEQGRVPAGAPLQDLLPDTAMDPAFASRTPEDLMAHAAGVGDAPVLGPAWLGTARSDPRTLPEQRAALAAAALGAPPAYAEGGFHYANLNFIIVGAILERATGMAWEDLMRAELFAPLGITTAGFGAPLGDQPWGTAMGIPVDPALGLSDNPLALGPAGTVHIGMEDYAKFLRLFMTEGGGLVSPEAMARITTAPVEGDGQYRMGWMVYGQRPWAQGPALAHEGSNTMWHAVTLLAPQRQIAIVAFSNDETLGGPAAVELAVSLLRQYAPV
jgi:CubicO group peptidase (beta-lactamase class C family)